VRRFIPFHGKRHRDELAEAEVNAFRTEPNKPLQPTRAAELNEKRAPAEAARAAERRR
jgi:hypothetical protein